MSDRKLQLLVEDKRSIRSEQGFPEASNILTVNHACESEIVNGETRFIETIRFPFRDQSGAVTGTLGFSRDITENKREQETLQENEERFRKVFEDAPIGMAMAGPDFRLFAVNTAFCRTLGYTEQEVAGFTFKDFLHPEDMVEHESRMNDLISQRTPVYKREERYRRKSGDIVWVSSTISIVRDRQGQFSHFLSITEDISQRRQEEAEKNHFETLLFQAQKMEAVGALAGGIAHDFNNILSTIVGFGSLLQTKMNSEDPGQAYLSQIVGSSKRAAQLTRSLLAFSKRQHLDIKPHKVNTIVRDMTQILTELLTGNIELKIVLSPEDPTIIADVTQVNQILVNFTNNAREAMPGGGTVVIETKAVKLDREFKRAQGFGEPGSYASICLSDTGIGMDEETRKRVFEPFFTTKGLGKGTGLGLSSVYGTVKQHGGYITVSSEPGQGSTFCTYFPMVSVEKGEERTAPAADESRSENKEKTELKIVQPKDVGQMPGTVLVAEDDPWVRELIAEILLEYGYTTVEATDGEEAIRLFAENKERVDLVIIDVAMPGRNGVQVFDEIRRMCPHMKALFTSGIADDLILGKGTQDGLCRFIAKPLSVDELILNVKQMLSA